MSGTSFTLGGIFRSGADFSSCPRAAPTAPPKPTNAPMARTAIPFDFIRSSCFPRDRQRHPGPTSLLRGWRGPDHKQSAVRGHEVLPGCALDVRCRHFQETTEIGVDEIRVFAEDGILGDGIRFLLDRLPAQNECGKHLILSF